ncbi:MAG: hypothetical protein M1816_006393 [Peltula sp. TS41687]|nr:MAG: hypothetical protein M1816_006393 [Peltula sp. TS41687]
MPASSLIDIAKAICLKNIKDINDVGDAPYETVRDVLLKVPSPEQLRKIEIASPQIMGQTAELWQKFIERDIPMWKTVPHVPKNPKVAYKVYYKLKADAQAKLDKDQSALKNAFQKIAAEKEAKKSRLVDISEVPNIGKHTRIGGPKPRKSVSPPSNEPKTAGQKALAKFRRDAHEKAKMFEWKPHPLLVAQRIAAKKAADEKKSLKLIGVDLPVTKPAATMAAPAAKPAAKPVTGKRDSSGAPIAQSVAKGTAPASAAKKEEGEEGGIRAARPIKAPRLNNRR